MMTRQLLRTRLSLSLFAGVLVAAGCDAGSKTPAKPEAGNGGTTAELPASLFLKAAPANPKNVGELAGTAKPGDAVVVRGVIGGSVDPFISKRAIMTVADRRMKSCEDMGGLDHCKTPWDYCCEPRESLKVNLASVQVVDGEGHVLKADLKGQGGLDPSRKIVIEGKVAPESSKDSLVINATGVYVEPKG